MYGGVWGEGLPRKRQRGVWGRNSLEKRKYLVVEGTPVMPLPTTANPVLCCNRIKMKYELPTLSPAHLFPIRGKRKRGPGTLQTRDQNLPK